MHGLNALTGSRLEGIDHLRQSIREILTTPLGSRVMRRDFGSRLFSLIDQPLSSSLKLSILAATVEALITWEPRIDVEEVHLASYTPGEVLIDLVGTYLPDGVEIKIEGILVK